MKNLNKRVTSLLAVLLIVTLFTSQWAVHGQSLSLVADIENNWAKEQILDWLDKGLINGYSDGSFKPNKSISRSEFVTIINKVFGYKDLAEETFKDVSKDKWYYEEISKAKFAGYISGYDDGTFKPDDSISRQEVAKIIYNLMKLNNLDNSDALNLFKDVSEIPSWSREYINAVAANGYINGFSDKTYRPIQAITRAETIVILDRIVGDLINSPGEYGGDKEQRIVLGNMTINTEDVTLKNTAIKGDLYLAAGIGDGEVYLDNVTVEGRVIVNGGGENSIILINSTINEAIVHRITGRVRIVTRGETKVAKVIIKTGVKLEEENKGKGFSDIDILVLNPQESIELVGGFKNISVLLNANIKISKDTEIERLETMDQAEGTTIHVSEGAILEEIVLNSATKLEGEGTIKTAFINSDGSTIEQKVEEYKLSENVKLVTIDGNEVTENLKEENKVQEPAQEQTQGENTDNTYPSDSTEDDTDSTPSRTPHPSYSGITGQVKGLNDTYKVTLTITVKNSSGQGISGYTPGQFSVSIDDQLLESSNRTLDYPDMFNSFVDNGDGTYNVVFQGFKDRDYIFRDLKVGNITIGEGPIHIEMPIPLASITKPIPNQINTVPDVIEGVVNPNEGQVISEASILIRRERDPELDDTIYLQLDGTWGNEEYWFEVEATDAHYATWRFALDSTLKSAFDEMYNSYFIRLKINDGEEQITYPGSFHIDKVPPKARHYESAVVKGNILRISFDEETKVSRFISGNTDFSNLIGPSWGNATIEPFYSRLGYTRFYEITLADDTELTDTIEVLPDAAEDKSGNINTETIVFDIIYGEVEQPNPPTNLLAQTLSNTSIGLSWDKAELADYYYVYYSNSEKGVYTAITDENGNKQKVLWESGNSFIDDSNMPYSTRYYKVTAVNKGVESDYSSPVFATTYYNHHIKLDFNVTDTVEHPDQPIIYITDKENMKLYAVNYDTEEISSISFELPPESLTYYNGEIYVSLLKGEHSSNWSELEQEGAIAIIDSETLEMKNMFDISIDPYDIVVDKNGYIYVSSGSGQWTYMKSYSRQTLSEVETLDLFRQQSYLHLHPIMNKLYTIDTDTSPRDIEVYGISNGLFVDPSYDSPYHGDYKMNTNMKISSDGKYIFNGAGTVFHSTDRKYDDMKYVYSLNSSFEDIDFELESNKFYTTSNKEVRVYNYENFNQTAMYNTDGNTKGLFNSTDKLIVMSLLNGKNIMEVVEKDSIEIVPPVDMLGVKLEGTIVDVVYDPSNNRAYAIDKAFKNLFVINLSDQSVENTIKLTYTPSGLTLSEDGSKLYIVNDDENFLVTEVALGSYEISRHLSFVVNLDEDNFSHKHIYNRGGNLYIVMGDWAPSLLVFNETTFGQINYGATIKSIGDMAFSSDNSKFYYWYQYGWGAGNAGSNVYAYSINGNTFTKIAESQLGYPNMSRDPLDTPIILLEDKGLIICKDKVLNANTLELIGSFPEAIYAISPSGDTAIGKNGSYDLTNYQKVETLSLGTAKAIFYDNNGIMYYIKDNTLYSN